MGRAMKIPSSRTRETFSNRKSSRRVKPRLFLWIASIRIRASIREKENPSALVPVSRSWRGSPGDRADGSPMTPTRACTFYRGISIIYYTFENPPNCNFVDFPLLSYPGNRESNYWLKNISKKVVSFLYV